MPGYTTFASVIAGLSLLVAAGPPAGAADRKSRDALPSGSNAAAAKKIDRNEIEALVDSCELPGTRTGHEKHEDGSHEDSRGRGHACEADSPG